MKHYVTRWALSTGIRVIDNGRYTDDGKYFIAPSDGIFVAAREAHETLEQALVCARVMATKKAKQMRANADKFSDPTWQPKVVGTP